MSVNLKSLIGKLNKSTRSALEAAAGLCLSRTHYNVEIEHYLLKLMEASDTDAARIFYHFSVNQSRLTADLTRSLDNLKSGNARTPAISPSILKMLTQAWTLGSIDYDAGQVRSGFTILALVEDDELARILRECSKELLKLEADALKKDFIPIVRGSLEDDATTTAEESSQEGASRPLGSGKTPNLDQFTINLSEKAKSGKLDPVLGRDVEIRQIIDILMRRRQNNPILTGEAGVGKTSVVEGLVLHIAQGDVPTVLKNVTVRTLDLALLQAGAGIKGEFENRLKGLIEEVKASPTPIILFIDEAHNMIGAGGQAGQNDAANLLKPALARGELRTIAATTWSEFKKYFEKDPALARRFQVVKVEEPAEEACMIMLRGIVSSLENHHKVRILDEGVDAATRLSHRFLSGRQLPDKAVSVLDTACARLALGQNSTPPPVEDARRQIDDFDLQERVLTREAAAGGDHAERLEQIRQKRSAVSVQLAELEKRFATESALVGKIRELRSTLEEGTGNTPSLRKKLDKLNAELGALQGDSPLMRVCVDGHIVSEVISAWTGIPTGKMVKDEIEAVLSLEEHLGARVIGQNHAMEAIAQRIRTSRAGMEDPQKPIGVFLLVGPSGVGKTETALALADLLYGGERNVITINMSEFQEAHTVSTLKGSPPGYVGYGEGGVLTEAVRRKPYSVVLLDEVEKAHPDVLELFFQVFDKGRMEDGEGREIDFKNTIILLTSNAATDAMMKLCADPETMPGPEGIVKAIKPELNKIFKPAFLGRLVIIPYYPIGDEALRKIIVLKLEKIQRRMHENHKIDMPCSDALIEEIGRRCTEVESGARNVDNILTNTLLPEISRQLLTRIAEGQRLESIQVDVGPDGAFVYS
ncbi:MAG: type VI secretion system ATPase TssH [Acidobacteria bacterium]|nr:type VI secretion system ATPase TssH [Acidobacteriota bacterium]